MTALRRSLDTWGVGMKVNDLVVYNGWDLDYGAEIGIVIEMIDHEVIPPVYRVLWEDGEIDRQYEDDLEVINESR